MEKSKETTKKIILNNVQIIDENNFVELYDKIISEYDYNEWKDVKDKLKKANVGEGMVGDVESKYYQTHRIKQIKCYNVGFGDCFLCKDGTDNGAKMLVDCGGEARKLSAVATDLMCEYANVSRKYLMLSHLHKDHYCGLKYLQDKCDFNEIYLPNYITNYGIEILGAVLLTSTNKTLINLVKEILKIPGLLSNFVTNTTSVKLLVEGDSVCNSLCAFDVLLPLKNKSYFNIKEFLPERIGVEIEEFSKQYKFLVGYNESEEYNCTISIHNDSLVNRIEQLIEQVVGLRNDVDLHINQSELKKIFKRYHNALSLAFHEKYVKEYENVLFLGDAEPTDIRHLTDNNKLMNEYCFVKVQHHGTRNYFYNGLPVSKYYAISNGGGRESWEITDAYDFQYGKCASFVCTNNCNCKKFKNNIICNAHSNMKTQCGVNLSYTVKI